MLLSNSTYTSSSGITLTTNAQGQIQSIYADANKQNSLIDYTYQKVGTSYLLATATLRGTTNTVTTVTYSGSSIASIRVQTGSSSTYYYNPTFDSQGRVNYVDLNDSTNAYVANSGNRTVSGVVINYDTLFLINSLAVNGQTLNLVDMHLERALTAPSQLLVQLISGFTGNMFMILLAFVVAIIALMILC